MVVAHTLATSVCSLLSGNTSSSSGITKAHLRQLREVTFEWPSEEDVLPKRLSPLPKNIAKNFIETFYKEKGVSLMQHEGLRLKEHICGLAFVVSAEFRFCF
jgi:hypothetical protein